MTVGGDEYSYGKLMCNMCWKELQAPYIVTACNHCFCMEHENDPRLQQSTCPGCARHLPAKGGVSRAQYQVDKSEAGALKGLAPDSVLHLAGKAIQFWVSQERTHAHYHQHRCRQLEQRKAEEKESYKQAHEEMAQELNTARSSAQQAHGTIDELRHEVGLLQEKHQEEARKVRTLQERMIEWKRKGGTASGMASPIPSEHDGVGHHLPPPSPMHSSHTRSRPPSPGYGGGLGGGMGHQRPSSSPSPWGVPSSPAPHRSGERASYDSARLGGLNPGSQPRTLGGQYLGGPFVGNSRHGTPVHRSASFTRNASGGIAPVPLRDGGMGLGGGGLGGMGRVGSFGRH